MKGIGPIGREEKKKRKKKEGRGRMGKIKGMNKISVTTRKDL